MELRRGTALIDNAGNRVSRIREELLQGALYSSINQATPGVLFDDPQKPRKKTVFDEPPDFTELESAQEDMDRMERITSDVLITDYVDDEEATTEAVTDEELQAKWTRFSKTDKIASTIFGVEDRDSEEAARREEFASALKSIQEAHQKAFEEPRPSWTVSEIIGSEERDVEAAEATTDEAFQGARESKLMASPSVLMASGPRGKEILSALNKKYSTGAL